MNSLVSISVFALFFILASCSVNSVKFNPDPPWTKLGGTTQLTLDYQKDPFTPANPKTKWESADANVFTVDSSGKITGVSIGKATIKVTIEDKTAEATATVYGRYHGTAKWGSSGSGNGQFNNLQGIAVDTSGNVYVADSANNCIQKFTSGGDFLSKWGSSGSGNGQLSSPTGLCFYSGYLYVCDTANQRIEVFDLSGNYNSKWGTSGSSPGQFQSPTSIAVDGNGTLWILDLGGKLQPFSTSGSFSSTGFTNITFPQKSYVGCALQSRIFVSDYNAGLMKVYNTTGTLLTTFGNTGSTKLKNPYGVTTDSSGNIYVIDDYNDRILKYDSTYSLVEPIGNLDQDIEKLFGYGFYITLDSSGNIFATMQISVIKYSPW